MLSVKGNVNKKTILHHYWTFCFSAVLSINQAAHHHCPGNLHLQMFDLWKHNPYGTYDIQGVRLEIVVEQTIGFCLLTCVPTTLHVSAFGHLARSRESQVQGREADN